MSGSQYNFLATPTVVNPAAALSNATQIAGQMNALQAFRAKQAAGQAFLSSINPDGTTNQTALLSALKADPTTALAAQDAAQSGQTLSADEYGQMVKRQAYGASGAMQVLADNNGTAPFAAIKAYYDRAKQDGHVTDADEQRVLAGFGDDPVANATIVRQRIMQNIAGQEAMARGQPQPAQQNIGGTVRTIDTNPNTNRSGPGSVGSTVPLSTTPEFNANFVQIPDPAHPGAMLMVPRSSLPGASGQGVAGAPAGAAPSTSALPNGGRLPPALLPGGIGGTGNAASSTNAASVPPGAIPATADPNVVAKNSADVAAYQADQRAIPDTQTAVQSLQKAQHALELSQSGRSTETVHQMYSFLTSQGFATPGLKDDVTNYDLAHKYMLDYARRSAGAGTDLQLRTSEGANASTGISQDAALQVLATNIGRERQKIAQTMETPDKTGVGYTSHAANFASSTDPRGFAFDTMAPAARDKMIAGMTASEKAKYYKSVGIASRLGLLNSQ